MPPRVQPKIYQLLFKTHTLTIFLTETPSTTIASVKEQVLSALVSDINRVEDVSKVTDVAQFEICRAVKDKGRMTGEYQVLQTTKQIRESNLANWEVLYLQFRDALSGQLLPITVTQPSTEDEEQPQPQPASSPGMDGLMSDSKGKRKAPPE